MRLDTLAGAQLSTITLCISKKVFHMRWVETSSLQIHPKAQRHCAAL